MGLEIVADTLLAQAVAIVWRRIDKSLSGRGGSQNVFRNGIGDGCVEIAKMGGAVA